MTKYLSRPEAADYVRETFGVPCTKTTLGKLASIGGGPAYRKFGCRALYTVEDLASWVDSRLSAPRLSTATH